MSLDPFIHADSLHWRRLTVFEPGRYDDGNLIATTDGAWVRMPLDTVQPTPSVDSHTYNTHYGQGLALAPPPETLEDVHEAIRSWCREFLGRDDVRFE